MHLHVKARCVISNEFPQIGSALHFKLQLFPLSRIEKAGFLEEDFSA